MPFIIPFVCGDPLSDKTQNTRNASRALTRSKQGLPKSQPPAANLNNTIRNPPSRLFASFTRGISNCSAIRLFPALWGADVNRPGRIMCKTGAVPHPPARPSFAPHNKFRVTSFGTLRTYSTGYKAAQRWAAVRRSTVESVALYAGQVLKRSDLCAGGSQIAVPWGRPGDARRADAPDSAPVKDCNALNAPPRRS
ncbi:hypothetical protein LY39_00310 [Roseinatronobacter bogoriensis subsp. barguzinensis]|nr:hypothetical protein [Rhodobaca bogoriensis DSM 18756]TDW41208.1 hypothetical protein LY39_00310 [Rhodobaca barguzinensis]TDY74614.1 hypothetical protein EV660_101655 [Rhodobaca bogoriensis DSM 18756]